MGYVVLVKLIGTEEHQGGDGQVTAVHFETEKGAKECYHWFENEFSDHVDVKLIEDK